MRRALFALGSLSLGGCGLPFDATGCTADVRPAVIVEIRDARTAAALAYDARGVIRDGAYVDSLTPYESSTADQRDLFSRQAGYERPGTYTVEVQRVGYRAWTTSGVRVTKGVCHVDTQRVRADLLPAA